MNSKPLNKVKEKIYSLLSETSTHIWVLGAGTGKSAKLPLMSELTTLAPKHLSDKQENYYSKILDILKKNSNVEDLLSFLIDIKQLIQRKRKEEYELVTNDQEKDSIVLSKSEIDSLHEGIRNSIKKIINSGIIRNDGELKLPSNGKTVVDCSTHEDFIKTLWKFRGGLEERRKPVPFFTLNYDPTLENALSMQGVSYIDGFIGSRTAYWGPEEFGGGDGYVRPFKRLSRNLQAKIYKLHGSIDWCFNEERIMRKGSELNLNKPSLIYPDSSKFELFKREPFSTMFDSFRNCLSADSEKLLVSIGYSWGDEHVNKEVMRAFENQNNNLTLLLFVKELPNTEENDIGLPRFVEKLLETSQTVSDNSVLVTTNNGFYRNGLERKHEFENKEDIWKFQGIVDLIKVGAR